MISSSFVNIIMYPQIIYWGFPVRCPIQIDKRNIRLEWGTHPFILSGCSFLYGISKIFVPSITYSICRIFFASPFRRHLGIEKARSREFPSLRAGVLLFLYELRLPVLIRVQPPVRPPQKRAAHRRVQQLDHVRVVVAQGVQPVHVGVARVA